MAQTKIKAGLFEGIIGNGTDGYFLMSNGDGTMTWSSIIINPTVTSIAYPGSVTAADPAGGETITVTGTGFKTGATVTVGGTAAPAVSYVSGTQITFTTPAKAAGDYDIVVTNTDTGSATYINGISYNGIPTWTTAAGSLGTFASNTTISTITLQATEPDAGTITFNITNGALPTGLSLTGANIDGTTSLETANTLYTFTVTATDDESQATPRTFTITVQKQFISTENFTINTYTGNGSTQSIEGKIGTAASFNGSSSKISIPSISPKSISMWVNVNSTSGTDALMGHDSITSNYIYWNTGDLTVDGNVFTNLDKVANQWVHIALVESGSNIICYNNGTPIQTLSGSLGTYNLIGARTAGTSQYTTGKIDQVRIFNTALDQAKVTQLYGENNASSTKSTTDIFDDGSGVALYEFEKGAIDTGGTNGYIGSAGVFDGSSSYIETPSLIPVNDYSFSCWVYFDSLAPASNYRMIYEAYKNTWWYLSIFDGGKIATYNGTSTFNTTSNLISTGQWYHIVYTSSSTAGKNIYLNGNSTPVATNGDTTGNSNPSGSWEGFGKYHTTGVGSMDGRIDQTRIFNRVLTTSEIATLYGETSASATKSTTDIFDDGSGVALYELEGNANDTGGTYNGTATNVSYAYDGTPTNVDFVGTSFQPDLVWIKARDGAAEPHQLFDSIRGVTKELATNSTGAEDTSSVSIDSFDSNGFSLNSDPSLRINKSSINYVAWCWKAGGAAVSGTGTGGASSVSYSANTDAGFSIVKYTKSSTSGTMTHGLDLAPELIIEKRTSADAYWNVRVEGITANNQTIYLNQTTEVSTHPSLNLWSTPTTSVFGYDSGNAGAGDYIAYCFHSVDGYQKIGSYTGTGATGNAITTGFQPRFVMIKSSSNAEPWFILDAVRDTSNPRDNRLMADSSAAEDDGSVHTVDFDSNGFTANGTVGNGTNGNGVTYIYLAIA